jgi:hypothetical protein
MGCLAFGSADRQCGGVAPVPHLCVESPVEAGDLWRSQRCDPAQARCHRTARPRGRERLAIALWACTCWTSFVPWFAAFAGGSRFVIGLRPVFELALTVGDPNGIRTRVTTLKGWCPRPLDDGVVGHSGNGRAAQKQGNRGTSGLGRSGEAPHRRALLRFYG